MRTALKFNLDPFISEGYPKTSMSKWLKSLEFESSDKRGWKEVREIVIVASKFLDEEGC